jgi:glycosyltransferase involved in cell wall biosynthesis
LLIVGDGPNGAELRELAAKNSWMKVVGFKTGRYKAKYFKISSVVLNPGLVGLHVLDAFCAGLPMLTTAQALHSPEIAYLRDRENGLIISGDPRSFAVEAVALLHDGPRLEFLRQAALADAQRFTLDEMVRRFADGIERCCAQHVNV